MKKLSALAALSPLFLASTVYAAEYSLMIFETKAELAARTDIVKSDAYWTSYNAFAGELAKLGSCVAAVLSMRKT